MILSDVAVTTHQLYRFFSTPHSTLTCYSCHIHPGCQKTCFGSIDLRVVTHIGSCQIPGSGHFSSHCYVCKYFCWSAMLSYRFVSNNSVSCILENSLKHSLHYSSGHSTTGNPRELCPEKLGRLFSRTYGPFLRNSYVVKIVWTIVVCFKSTFVFIRPNSETWPSLRYVSDDYPILAKFGIGRANDAIQISNPAIGCPKLAAIYDALVAFKFGDCP